MLDLSQIKITPRDHQVLDLLVQGLQQQRDCCGTEYQSKNGEATPAYLVPARRHQGRPQASETSHRVISTGGVIVRKPHESLTPKESQVATLVWEGMTNREIAKLVGTTEQVVKNYLRTTFDKLGVWSRLELALYVANHGGRGWLDSLREENTARIAGSRAIELQQAS